MKKNTDQYVTPSGENEQLTVQSDGAFPNQKNVARDSVEEHKNLETANILLGEDEIRQQNENL
ncbi:hypothetical protein LRR81_08215 [Metabacillus sp. GX 13764]|uniref:hypothetical protein n=1 Tax=Metabacillus kandeliae TaxID=2900151 RepID=UPI001E565F4D|nr:hypothetical protein [Metabacillus kandeliae]MCD7034216.1 hypothetical protein [Metabacillus kandeliae]